jgi:hypothetical protein
MLKHPDPEVQFLVETLEGQRDGAVVQAAALFRKCQELEKQLKEAQNALEARNIGQDPSREHQAGN